MMREENGKVYMLTLDGVTELDRYKSKEAAVGYNAPEDAECLIYDFNLNPGDKFIIGDDREEVTVEAVEKIEYAGEERILVQTSNSDYISGVGAIDNGTIAFPFENICAPMPTNGYQANDLVDIFDETGKSLLREDDHVNSFFTPEENWTLCYSLDRGDTFTGSERFEPIAYTISGTTRMNNRNYRNVRERESIFEAPANTPSAMLLEEDGCVYMYRSLENGASLWEYPSAMVNRWTHRDPDGNLVDGDVMIYDFNGKTAGCTYIFSGCDDLDEAKTKDRIHTSWATGEYVGEKWNIRFDSNHSSYIRQIGAINDGTLAFPHITAIISDYPKDWEAPKLVEVINEDGERIWPCTGDPNKENSGSGEYKKMLVSGRRFYYSPDPETTYYYFGEEKSLFGRMYTELFRHTEEKTELIAWMREDGGKVYCRPLPAAKGEAFGNFGAEVLIYDFNLSKGEKYVAYVHTDKYAGHKMTVQNARDVRIAPGESRRQIVTGSARYMEEFGVVKNGTIGFPEVAGNVRQHRTLRKVTDAGGNEIFNYEEFLSIGEIDSEYLPDAEYFTLQGVKVENPGRGIYIRRCGDKTEKVVIR